MSERDPNEDAIRRLLLDTDALDKIATMPDFADALRGAATDGRVELFITHVQLDQIIVMADKQATKEKRAKRGRLLTLIVAMPNVRYVPTSGIVVGLSRLGQAALDDLLAVETKTGPPFARKPKNRADVLLVNTAAGLGAEFVSVDTGARKYAAARGLVVSTPAELLASLAAPTDG
jgi:hypothetical protein